MDDAARAFLERLLETPSPSGYETDGQRAWIDYVSDHADEVHTDDYGNAVAVLEGGDPAVALAGHADEIGFIVRRIDDEGFLRVEAIGGSDASVAPGQHVTVHAADGPVAGVVGRTAVHLRDRDDDEIPDIGELHVDVGAADGAAARDLVEVGDPVTFEQTVADLDGGRLAARGVDNRVGTWAAAEGLRRAAEAGADATVYAVSTVQEELGHHGAKMVGFDLDPDAVVAADVTHATDYPSAPEDKGPDVELGGGPVVYRGSTNHPVLVRALREAASRAGVPVQLAAAGSATWTDADDFFTQRGGIPSAYVAFPNRYMHTPVEVIDAADADAVADLLAAFADGASEHGSFAVEV